MGLGNKRIGWASSVVAADTVLRYKALISQNAPIATTLNPAMVAGQIWTLESYDAADATAIAGLELISGTLNAVGSKYRSAIDQNLVYAGTTTLSYDGAPYVVSTDVNGNFAPFVNTLGGNPGYNYLGVGGFELTLAGVFIKGKTFMQIESVFLDNGIIPYIDTYSSSPNIIYINTLTIAGSGINNELYYTPIEIEVYQ